MDSGDLIIDDPKSGLRPQDIDLIGHVKVNLRAELGTIDLTIEKLFSLKSGDILAMNESLEAPIDLLLNGQVVARGELLAVDDNFGVRILEVE